MTLDETINLIPQIMENQKRLEAKLDMLQGKLKPVCYFDDLRNDFGMGINRARAFISQHGNHGAVRTDVVLEHFLPAYLEAAA